ncbi:MAG: hypothetical protein AAB414_02515 [Patescibacteria group bacterium]
MITKSIFKKNEILIILLILGIIVVTLQFTILELALKIGFKPDDWILYFTYKSLGSNPLSEITKVWAERGIYTTYQVYYMGMLEALVGFDYRLFQVLNITFKALGTMAIFPLVLIIFKDKLLAILTTLFFAISASSIGPLEFVVKGSDYVAIFWMCVFLITYYLIVTKYPRNFLWLIVSFILFLLSLLFSPIRLFPLLVLLPLIETYHLIKNLNLDNVKNILIRMSIFYLPLLILIVYAPDSVANLLGNPLSIFKKVGEGNWHLLLSPFSGMGHTFIPGDYWQKIFGLLTADTLPEYTFFLLGGPTVIFGTLTLLVAFLKSKRPWLFFLITFCLNFISEILVFFVATHSKYLPKDQGMHYEPTGIYSALFGIYILVLGSICFMEWLRKDRNDYLLLAFWLGPLFLFIFTFATWAFAPFGTSFSGTHPYLVVSAIGSSLLLSAFVSSIFKRVISIRGRLFRSILLIPIFIIVISIFVMNGKEISMRFLYLLANGRAAYEQQLLQGKFKERLGNFDNSKPSLFYFDTSDLSEGGPFYSEGFLASFPFWMHFRDNNLIDGCLEILYLNEHKQLLSYIKEQDGERGLFFRGLCMENGKSSYKEILYKPENFYAFKIKSRDFIDIKKDLLKELGF